MRRETILERGSTLLNITPSRLVTLILAGSAAFSLAGPTGPAPSEPPPVETKDWCDVYKSIGKVYSDPDNPWIQEIDLDGRVQWQWGYVDGEAGGDDFTYSQDEFRRMRLGGGVKFLQWFEAKGHARWFDDDHARGGNSRGPEFLNMWDLYLKFNAKKAFGIEGVDALKIGYGSREVNSAEEWNTSSKKIKTVERSAIANKIWPFDTRFSNPTGVWVEGAKGNFDAQLGVFSTTQADSLASWNDGQLYYAKLEYDFSEGSGFDLAEAFIAGFYQDVDITDDRLGGGVEGAGSAAVRLGKDRWAVRLNAILGENGDQTNAAREGSFWGFVVIPTYWLIEDKLEAVASYQYQGAEEEQGIRINSRYVRRASADRGVAIPNGGRGDEHHSIYGGLNLYLCSDNVKLMAGVQYDEITSDGSDVFDGWTTYLAFRTFF